MKSKKALVNAIYGMVGYIILMVTNLVTRSFLVRTLQLDLAGVDTVFKNFLSFLSLAELGLSTGLIYKLYDPILQDNKIEIKKILNFYKQAYKIISLVFMSGAVVFACLTWVAIKEFNPIYLGILFMLYAGDTVASYLYANRKALIIADQRNYIVSRNDALISIGSMVVQVGCLLYLPSILPINRYVSFIIFAAVKIVCRIIGALFIGRKFKQLYPDIYADKSTDTISKPERKALYKNMSAMLMHRIGAVSVTASGSAIVSGFKDVKMAGVYGNYMIIVNALNMMLAQIFNGVTASFGQLSVSSDREQVQKKFNLLYFTNFLIMAFFTTSFAVIVQPFIKVWIGDNAENLFPDTTVFLLCAYIYISGIRRVIIMAKDSAGLFRPDRYLALLEATINIVLSIILINVLGVAGLIIANFVSMLIVPLWSQPYLVFKYVLQNLKKFKFYYLRYVIYIAAAAGEMFLTFYLAKTFIDPHLTNIFLNLLVRVVLCVIVPNVINLVLFFKTSEMKDLLQTVKQILQSFKKA